MQVKDLKQRWLLKNIHTGEICRVSKRWEGIYLVNPETNKKIYLLARHNSEMQRVITNWEKV